MQDLIVSLCSTHWSTGNITWILRSCFSRHSPMQSSGTPFFSQHVSLNLYLTINIWSRLVSLNGIVIMIRLINVDNISILGHSSMLHSVSRVASPSHSPPKSSTWVFSLMSVWTPSPHVLEHSPICQSPHSQTTIWVINKNLVLVAGTRV